MSERWIDIEEFPEYEISDHGNVFSKKTGRNLSLSLNSSGAVKVNLYAKGVHTRSVRVLVAEAFVPLEQSIASAEDETFDVVYGVTHVREIRHRIDILEVINVDGDQQNNHYTNLAWRPHWFACKYTQQFTRGPRQEYNVYLLNTQSGVMFDNVMDAGLADGVLWEYVYKSAVTGRPVYPTGAVYEFVAPGTVSLIKQRL